MSSSSSHAFLDGLAVDTRFAPRPCLPGDDVTSDVTRASNTIIVGSGLRGGSTESQSEWTYVGIGVVAVHVVLQVRLRSAVVVLVPNHLF